MTVATRTPFVVERVDLREPDLTETWEVESVEDAAAQFESEASPQNWALEDIEAELAERGELRTCDDDARFEFVAKRRDVAGWVR